MTNLLLRAIKRRHTPESAMAALGLDARLLDEARAEVRRARTRRRRLAADAGEVVLPDPDDDGPDSEELLGALKELLASGRLSDVQKAWVHALLSGEDVGDPPGPDDAEAQDDDLPRPGGELAKQNLIDHQPTAADRRRALAQDSAARNRLAYDTAASARFPNAAKVTAFDATWPGPSRPTRAYDSAAHGAVPATVRPAETRFSFGQRVRGAA